MSHQDFLFFSSPTNHAAQLLLAHVFLLDYLVCMTAYRTQWKTGFKYWGQVMLAWLEQIAGALPAGFRGYMEWPLGAARRVMRDPGAHLESYTPSTLEMIRSESENSEGAVVASIADRAAPSSRRTQFRNSTAASESMP